MPSRLDRFITLYFFHPLSLRLRLHDEAHVPILMYHSISNDAEESVHPYFRTCTSPDVFAEHMKYLHDNDYSVISLSHAVTQLTSNQLTGNHKFVAVTFDDGFRDFYTDAFPVLQKYNFPAAMFLASDFIDNKRPFKGRECLSWAEVREMHGKGILFGSHTASHPELKRLKEKEIEGELKQSKEVIEDRIGAPVESFSYPYAFPEERKEVVAFLRSTLERLGYCNGVTTRLGTATINDNKYFLKRIPVNSMDDISFFKAKLDGGYDWLYRPQYIVKALKGKISRTA